VDKFVLKDFNYKINGLKKSHNDRLIIYNKISGSMFLQSHLKNIFYYPLVSVLIVVILNNVGLINFVNIMDNLYNYLLFKILFNVIVSIYFIYIITVILIMINRYFILKLERRKNFALVNKLVSLIFLARKIYILLIIAILFLVIITSIKLSLATLLASTGIFTLIIGFGAKDVLTSFFS
jgi:small-conductance mechanosensitive channel